MLYCGLAVDAVSLTGNNITKSYWRGGRRRQEQSSNAGSDWMSKERGGDKGREEREREESSVMIYSMCSLPLLSPSLLLLLLAPLIPPSLSSSSLAPPIPALLSSTPPNHFCTPPVLSLSLPRLQPLLLSSTLSCDIQYVVSSLPPLFSSSLSSCDYTTPLSLYLRLSPVPFGVY